MLNKLNSKALTSMLRANGSHVVIIGAAGLKHDTISAIRWFLETKQKPVNFNGVTVIQKGAGVLFKTNQGEMLVTPVGSSDNFKIHITKDGKNVGLTVAAFMDITDTLKSDDMKVLKYMSTRLIYWLPKLEITSKKVA